MIPNNDQVLALVRAVLSIVGTFLTTKGLVSAADWTTYAGAVMMVAPVVWSMFAHTDSAKVASVVALAQDPQSAVKGIITENSPAGRDLAASTPGPIVVAGTQSAVEIAKAA